MGTISSEATEKRHHPTPRGPRNADRIDARQHGDNQRIGPMRSWLVE
jgi:hypothetical protein